MTRPPGKRSARSPRSARSATPAPVPPRKRSAVVRLIQLVSINLLVLLGLLTVLEVGARLWFPRDLNVVFDNPQAFRRGRPYVQDHAERGFVLRAGYSTPRMTVSRTGYRTHAPDMQEAVLRDERILCVGGSTTFGWGLADHESYPAQLQRFVDDSWPGRISVVNAGVPSYTSEQIRLYLPELLELSPRVVVVQTLWNDLLFSFVDNWFPDILVHQRPHAWRRFLLQKSALYRAFVLQEPDDSKPAASSPKARQHYADNLRSIVRTCRAQGADVVFSMPPLQESFVPQDGMRIGPQRVPRDVFLESATVFSEVLAEVARELDVTVVDHRVAHMARPEKALFLDAAHPQATGYRLLAEDVFDVLLELQRTVSK